MSAFCRFVIHIFGFFHAVAGAFPRIASFVRNDIDPSQPNGLHYFKHILWDDRRMVSPKDKPVLSLF